MDNKFRGTEGFEVEGLGFDPRSFPLRAVPVRHILPQKNRPDNLPYRGNSLIRNNPSIGPYSRTMPRALCWSLGGGAFLMSEVPLYRAFAPGLGCRVCEGIMLYFGRMSFIAGERAAGHTEVPRS